MVTNRNMEPYHHLVYSALYRTQYLSFMTINLPVWLQGVVFSTEHDANICGMLFRAVKVGIVAKDMKVSDRI
jgi:hypothetical protein